jgi:hypothetical protein
VDEGQPETEPPGVLNAGGREHVEEVYTTCHHIIASNLAHECGGQSMRLNYRATTLTTTLPSTTLSSSTRALY